MCFTDAIMAAGMSRIINAGPATSASVTVISMPGQPGGMMPPGTVVVAGPHHQHMMTPAMMYPNHAGHPGAYNPYAMSSGGHLAGAPQAGYPYGPYGGPPPPPGMGGPAPHGYASGPYAMAQDHAQTGAALPEVPQKQL
jgi:hypothetical protein